MEKPGPDFHSRVMLRRNSSNLIGWKWSHDIKQPIRMLEFQRSVTLCWKYIYRIRSSCIALSQEICLRTQCQEIEKVREDKWTAHPWILDLGHLCPLCLQRQRQVAFARLIGLSAMLVLLKDSVLCCPSGEVVYWLRVQGFDSSHPLFIFPQIWWQTLVWIKTLKNPSQAPNCLPLSFFQLSADLTSRQKTDFREMMTYCRYCCQLPIRLKRRRKWII